VNNIPTAYSAHAYFHHMFLLSVAVLANILIAICFKLYTRMGVDPFTAIVVNYLTSLVLGSVISGQIPLVNYAPFSVPWTSFAFALGSIFVIGFTVIAFSIRYAGIAITTAMQKMSLLVSAGYAILFFGEPIGPQKLTGVLLAMIAILMITRNETQSAPWRQRMQFLLLPLGTLLFSGTIEAILYHVHAHHLATRGDIVFTTYAFSIAGCIGIVFVILRHLTGKHKMRIRDIIGGVALGIPNFFSIYLILSLLHRGFSGSVLYPVLNILVLLFSAMVGISLFREKLQRVNMIGIGLALVAIALISLAD